MPFQSTLPARGATCCSAPSPNFPDDFNPRSLHGERRYSFLAARRHSSISIHAPCTGSDFLAFCLHSTTNHFNPRSLHGERPGESSISSQLSQFQSTLPARGATLFRALRRAHIVISIHAPCTGSDDHQHPANLPVEISIHAPCTGSDPKPCPLCGEAKLFQSTLPARGATVS